MKYEYKFEDKFIKFRWDDNLINCMVFYANDLPTLEKYVLSKDINKRSIPSKSSSTKSPFLCNDENHKFIYYDPNYEIKLAFERGEEIQARLLMDLAKESDWKDIKSPDWKDNYEYRIKPENDYYVVLGNTMLLSVNNFELEKYYKGRHIYYTGPDKLCLKWIEDRNKFYEIMKAWESGKQIEFLGTGGEWKSCDPQWYISEKYRVKPEGIYYVYLDDPDPTHEPKLIYSTKKPVSNHIYYTTNNQHSAEYWCYEHGKFAVLMASWESGSKVEQYESFNGIWIIKDNPTWDTSKSYRLADRYKITNWRDLKVGDVIKSGYKTRMIIGIDDVQTCEHIFVADKVIRDVDLYNDWIKLD
jgi:hypothetical protein